MANAGQCSNFPPGTQSSGFCYAATTGDLTSGVSLDSVSSFTVPPNTFTKVRYTTKLYDDWQDFNTTTNEFVAAQTGDYEVCASLFLGASVNWELDIFRNGIRQTAIAGGDAPFLDGCRDLRLTVGDTVTIRAYQSGPTTLTVSPNSIWDWMTVFPKNATLSLGDSSQFSIAASTFTKVPYTQERYDDRAEFDLTRSRFTASRAGDYEVCASLYSPTASQWELDLYKNGARENAIAGARSTVIQGCRVIRLAARDYIEVWTHSNVARTVQPNVFWNWMTVSRQASRVSMDNINAFTVSPSAFKKVPYTAALYIENSGEFSIPNSRFVSSLFGDYEVCASLYSAITSARWELDLFKNGTRENAIAGSTSVVNQGCRVIRLAPGDYVEVWVYQGTSGSVTISPNSIWDWMTVTRL